MRPKLYRVWLCHRLLGNCVEARRVAAYSESQAIEAAKTVIGDDARQEGSILHDHGVDLLPREWRVDKVEEIPSL
jgi:hypothetical protein